MKNVFKLGWVLAMTLILLTPAGLVAETGDDGDIEHKQKVSRRALEQSRGLADENEAAGDPAESSDGAVQSGIDLGLVKRGRQVAPEADAPAADHDTNGESDSILVVICHRPGTRAERTMMLPEPAIPGHLGHGDELGPCPSDETPVSN